MFRYERMPPELTWRHAAWYVVDRDREVWLESLGTNGPEGHLVFALCVRGVKVPFEVDPWDVDGAPTRAVIDGVPTYRVSSFGYSSKARRSHGIEPYAVPQDDALELQDLAVEAMLAFMAAAAQRRRYDPGELQVRLSVGDGAVRRLTDFGYGDGAPTEVERR